MNKVVLKFMSVYKVKYGSIVLIFLVFVYDLVYMIKVVIEKEGLVNFVKIVDGLVKFKNFKGVIGMMIIDK